MPEPDPFVHLDATAQAALARAGEVRPIELVEAAIARVEALDDRICAVTARCFEAARRRALGERLEGPFAGVPYLVKDLSALAGAPLTFGCRFFRRMRARRNEDVVQRAVDSGLIPLGKTNTPEFGLLASTEPLLFAPTRNPWSLAHSPGGSSGGAAAAVASGMVPLAHGGDGGGSIRIPASNCGVFGFKPSRDRCTPQVRRSAGDLSVQLCVSRSVRDSARMLAITELSPNEGGWPAIGYVGEASSRRLRIGLAATSLLGAAPEPDVAAALDRAARLCAELGHRVEEAPPPAGGAEAVERFVSLWAATPAAVLRHLWLLRIRMLEWRSLERTFEPWSIGLAERHWREEAAEPGVVARAVAYFQDIERQFDAYYLRHDVLLTPVLRRPPALIGEQAPSVPFETLLERSVDTVCYTPVHNAIGAPAMAVPMGESRDGLPLGVQFAARPGDDKTLLHLAYELEQARPWADRWPACSIPNAPIPR